jgi:hypothetical protein
MNEASTEQPTNDVRSLTVVCPACSSTDVSYSCVPDCCFNHVCAACLNSFELSTEDLGEEVASVTVPESDEDPSRPTVACARCQSLAVYELIERQGPASSVICISCRAVLRLCFSS